MSAIDQLLERNRPFRSLESGHAAAPTLRVTIVACMDARLPVEGAVGLKIGEAHVLRNAGGIVTDDIIRSLWLSQQALGTREIMLIHHTKCGVQGVDENAVRAQARELTGQAPSWAAGGFDDIVEDVRESMRRLRTSPFVVHDEVLRGFVYDVDTGDLHEVDPAG